MHISTKGRYALIIMTELAKRKKEDKYITLKEIASNNKLSIKYLERIMGSLNKADYFFSSRGIDGGYKLKYDLDYYKIGDIIRLAEGDIKVVDCLGNNLFSCPAKSNCKTYNLWNDLNNLINDYLDSKTLKDII